MFSDPAPGARPAHHRVDVPGPGALPATPELPPDTRWHPVRDLPPMAFDHAPMVEHARTPAGRQAVLYQHRIRPGTKEFALSTLRDIYSAALGHPVDATNLQRVLERRNVITRTGTTAAVGPQRRPAGRAVPVHRVALPGDRRIRRICARRGESAGFLDHS